MAISHNTLCKKLIHKKTTRTQLKNLMDIFKLSLARFRKNKNIIIDIFGRIYTDLNCVISNVMSSFRKEVVVQNEK